jgi:exosortase
MSQLELPVEMAPPRRAAPLPVPSRLYITGGLLTLACLPWLFLHAANLWQRSEYQFFPLVLAGSVVLAVRAVKGLNAWVPGARRLTFALLGCCWVGLLLASLPYSPRLGTMAALVLLGVALYAVGGAALCRRLLPAWAFLWLFGLPPTSLDQRLMTGLQGLTARWSSNVLDVFGVWHVLAGNVIEVPGQRLLVEDACSGVHSLFAVLTCTLFLAIWLRYHWLRALLLLAMAVFWVLLANVARVVAVA